MYPMFHFVTHGAINFQCCRISANPAPASTLFSDISDAAYRLDAPKMSFAPQATGRVIVVTLKLLYDVLIVTTLVLSCAISKKANQSTKKENGNTSY